MPRWGVDDGGDGELCEPSACIGNRSSCGLLGKPFPLRFGRETVVEVEYFFVGLLAMAHTGEPNSGVIQLRHHVVAQLLLPPVLLPCGANSAASSLDFVASSGRES